MDRYKHLLRGSETEAVALLDALLGTQRGSLP